MRYLLRSTSPGIGCFRLNHATASSHQHPGWSLRIHHDAFSAPPAKIEGVLVRALALNLHFIGHPGLRWVRTSHAPINGLSVADAMLVAPT